MAKTRKARGRPSTGIPRRKVIAAFKGSPEFESWVEDLVRFLRVPTSTALEHGLIELARARGYPDPPPER